MADVRLSVRNLDKSFSAPVLKQVNLSVAAGEIHAIVGENGAGKSTLVNILAGLLDRDHGELLLDGAPYEPRTPKDSAAEGVSFAAQELSVIGTLSVAENIALRGLPHRYSVIDKTTLKRDAQLLLRAVGLDVSPDAITETLGLADRQLVELAKALAPESRLLILDEPTAALAAPQAERVHEIMRDRAASGAAVIYISHRLADVLSVAEKVSVLRDGEVVASAPATTMTMDAMMELMTGSSVTTADATYSPRLRAKPALVARGIVTDELPHAIDVTCHAGEIVGVAGLAGAGKSELMQALFGLAPLRKGELRRVSDDSEVSVSSASVAVQSGVGFLAEDRQSLGIYPGHSVLMNMMTPGRTHTRPTFARFDRDGESASGDRLRRRLDIRCNNLAQRIDELSGGNQQKTLLGRWLHCESDVLLLDEPTRGVDVGTKSAIYRLLLELRDGGKAIVVASSETEELMAVCDRILVLSNRRVAREFSRDAWSETAILAAAFSGFTTDRAQDARSAN